MIPMRSPLALAGLIVALVPVAARAGDSVCWVENGVLLVPAVAAGVNGVFILGGAVAHQLSAGFVPLRKKGKLPHQTIAVDYALEYGVDTIEMHLDAFHPGEKVMLVDDLIATGGTAIAAVELLRQGGAEVIGAAFVVNLPDLGGAARLADLGVPVSTLVDFPGH